jgi:tRNA (guanosine-2'-O-)-methyltransferase
VTRRMAVQVVVTHLQADAVDVREVDWTRPTAIVLGNERAGGRACLPLSQS